VGYRVNYREIKKVIGVKAFAKAKGGPTLYELFERKYKECEFTIEIQLKK